MNQVNRLASLLVLILVNSPGIPVGLKVRAQTLFDRPKPIERIASFPAPSIPDWLDS